MFFLSLCSEAQWRSMRCTNWGRDMHFSWFASHKVLEMSHWVCKFLNNAFGPTKYIWNVVLSMYCLFIAISLWHFCQLAHFTCFPLCCIRLDFLKAKLSLIKHKITSLLHCRHFYWKSTLTDQVFGCTRKFEICLFQKKSSSKCYYLECEAPPMTPVSCHPVLSQPSAHAIGLPCSWPRTHDLVLSRPASWFSW